MTNALLVISRQYLFVGLLVGLVGWLVLPYALVPSKQQTTYLSIGVVPDR